jgi:hypothetical protein
MAYIERAPTSELAALKACLIHQYGEQDGFERYLRQISGNDPDVRQWWRVIRRGRREYP